MWNQIKSKSSDVKMGDKNQTECALVILKCLQICFWLFKKIEIIKAFIGIK